MGINPQSDGRVIRLVFPILSQERRNELVKRSKRLEKMQGQIRNIRRRIWISIKSRKRSRLPRTTIPSLKRYTEATDESTAKIDDIVKEKTEEIMEV